MEMGVDDGHDRLVHLLLNHFQNRLPLSHIHTGIKRDETRLTLDKREVIEGIADNGPNSLPNLDDLRTTKSAL